MFGRKKEVAVVNADKIDTILGKNVECSGKLSSQGIVQVEGKFEGEIECTQDLIICEGGSVNAEVKARHAIIAGNYTGNIELEGKLEIKSTGKVLGDIKVANLVIEDGAIFDGKCEMNQEGGKNLKLVKNEQKAEA